MNPVIRIVLATVVLACLGAPRSALADPSVCQKPDMVEFINKIWNACNTPGQGGCNEAELKQIETLSGTGLDRATIMFALKTLRPIHVFFPMGKSDIGDALDWPTQRQDQFEVLKKTMEGENTDGSIVFVIGRASATGSAKLNFELSQKRTLSVYQYLRGSLKLNCTDIQKVWFGREVMQLKHGDARQIEIEKEEYRDNELILNQSVEVFVWPCKNKIRTLQWQTGK